MPAKYDRIYDGMRKAFFISLVLTGFAAVVCVFFGRAIVGLFLTAPTEEVFSYAMVYLRTISVFFFFLSILYLYRTSLQGLGKGMVPMIGGILELIGRLAVILLFAKDYGYPAVCLASPVAWILAGIPNMAAYLLWKRRTKNLL